MVAPAFLVFTLNLLLHLPLVLLQFLPCGLELIKAEHGGVGHEDAQNHGTKRPENRYGVHFRNLHELQKDARYSFLHHLLTHEKGCKIVCNSSNGT